MFLVGWLCSHFIPSSSWGIESFHYVPSLSLRLSVPPSLRVDMGNYLEYFRSLALHHLCPHFIAWFQSYGWPNCEGCWGKNRCTLMWMSPKCFWPHHTSVSRTPDIPKPIFQNMLSLCVCMELGLSDPKLISFPPNSREKFTSCSQWYI